MNYFHPLYKPSEKKVEFNKAEFELYLDKVILISQLSEGGISYTDCENMDIYELEYLASKLIKLKKEEINIRNKQLEKVKKQ